MWAEILMGVISIVTFLYVPGFLFFRGMRFSNILSFCCAPVYSVCAYAALPILYYKLGIPCNLPSMLLPPLLVAAAIFGIGYLRHPERSAILGVAPEDPWGHDAEGLSFDFVVPLLYVAVAAVVCGLTFTRHLPLTESFYAYEVDQGYLNIVQSFLDSKTWSSFHSGAHLASPANAIPIEGCTESFYPSAWHDLVALMCLSSGFSVPAATNCVLVAMCVVVLPLGTFVLLRALFPNQRLLVGLGALVTSMFSTWPWVYVVKGPTYLGLLGMALMVEALAVVAVFCETCTKRDKVIPFVVFCGISFAALTLAHPNSIFTAYVFLAGYGAHYVNRLLTKKLQANGASSLLVRIIAMCAYWAAIVGVWILCYGNPLLSDILSYHYSENTSLLKSLISLFSFRLIVGGTQFVVCLLVLVGTIRCIRERQWWLLFAPAFFSLCFVACRCGWETIKYWLAAPWFMTPYRLSACISLFCIPIATLGMESIVLFVRSRQLPRQQSMPRVVVRLWQPKTIAALLFVLAIMPNIRIPMVHKKIETSFGRVSDSIHKLYANIPERVYTAKEAAFVEQVMEELPEGALVINAPNDGSVWSYGVNGLNTYYRSVDTSTHTDDATIIRERLKDYATDEAVRDAVDRTGASYVLLLDKDTALEEGTWMTDYDAEQAAYWSGITEISGDIPGFELVLKDSSDLRLYKIVDTN